MLLCLNRLQKCGLFIVLICKLVYYFVMNTLDISAQSSSVDADIVSQALAGYTWLTVLIPVMIFLIAVFVLIGLFILSSMSDKLTDIRDRLIEERDINESLAKTNDSKGSIEEKRSSLINERRDFRDKANTRSIYIWSAVIAIPVLFVIFVLIINLT